MNNLERSFLLVKPDGVAKGYVDEIRKIILSYGLIILEEIRKTISSRVAEDLYSEISDVRQRDYFPELIEFMSSNPIHIFVVQGNDAVKKVRTIIGKRDADFGIRRLWSEDIIRNVAHGPHTVERAEEELLILKRKEILMKKVFVIGGMSESGKSSVGRYLDSKGIRRLKIVSFLENIKEREGATGSFVEWNNDNVLKRPEWVREEFTKEFTARMEEKGIECCALESLYGPELAVYMKSIIGNDKVVIVYVNMDVDVRLQRQMIREGLTSLDEAKKLLLPRDEIKKAWGVPKIEAVADVIIDNSGTFEDLYRKVDEAIKQHCPEYL